MKKLILFGAGALGRRAQKDIGKEKIAFYVDNNKYGEYVDGIKVLSFEEFLAVHQNYNVVISNKSYWKDIKEQLLEHNIQVYAMYGVSDWEWCIEDVTYDELIDSYVKNNDISQGAYLFAGSNPMVNYIYDMLMDKGVNLRGVIIRPEDEIVIDIKGKVIDKEYALKQKDVKMLIANVELFEMDFLDEWNDDGCKKSWELKEIYKCNDKFYNKEMEKYRDLHKGEKCFIIGTGPSLKIEDLDQLHKKGICCFATNKIYLAFDKTEWRPNYYVVQDNLFLEYIAEDIKKLSIKDKFVGDSNSDFWINEDDGLKFHLVSRKIYPGMPKFSDDISRCIYDGMTVTYSAMQVAAYMGFSEIYLLGIDFNMVGKVNDDRNHFVKGYIAKNEKVNIADQSSVLHAYMSAKKYADDNGIKIYNATRGGKLEVFERVNFDDVIGE